VRLFRHGPNRLERLLAKVDLEEAARRAVPVWLEVGTRITAVTDAGHAAEGTVGRVYQTPRDVAAGVFRFACDPVTAGASSEDGEAAS